jgi:hypothetical protein
VLGDVEETIYVVDEEDEEDVKVSSPSSASYVADKASVLTTIWRRP